MSQLRLPLLAILKNKIKTCALLLAIVLNAITLGSLAYPANSVDPISATSSARTGVAADVDGHPIPISEVSELALQHGGQTILNQLIGNALIDQEATNQGVIVSPADIDSDIAHTTQQIAPQTLTAFLGQRNLTLTDYRNYVKVQLEVDKLIGPTLKSIKMAHLRDILINVDSSGDPSSTTTSGQHKHTLAQAQTLCSLILAKLKHGMTFQQAAQRYSEDAGNSSSGGDIGIVTDVPGVAQTPAGRAFSRVDSFVDIAFALKPGEITQVPIQTQYGLHIVELVSVGDNPLPGEQTQYQQLHDSGFSELIGSAASSYVSSLGSKAHIVEYLDAATQGPDGVAATVNGAPVELSDVSAIAFRQFGQTVLNRLIINQVVDDEAKDDRVSVPDTEIDAKLDQIRKQIAPQTIETVLAQSHTTLDELRTQQRVQIEVSKLITRTLPEFEISHIRHIAILVLWPGSKPLHHATQYTPADAAKIISIIQARLKGGADFGALAKQYSEDPTTKGKMGDLGLITGKDPYEASFLTAALSLKSGQTTLKAVKTSYGLELIQALSTYHDHPVSEDAMYEQSHATVTAREVDAQMHDFIPGLLAHHKIVNYLAN